MSTQQRPTQKISGLEDLIQYQFHNKDLLWQAITHSTAINERHPAAYNHDLNPLAFVGDAVLKYAVARQLYVNGRDDIPRNQAELHKGAQTVISNAALAKIAREEFHLENYLIRGGNHQRLSDNMYADCLEAIFGAIALDCEDDQRRLVLEIIPRICSRQIDSLLRPGGVPATSTQTVGSLMAGNRRTGRIDSYRRDWPMRLLEPALTNSKAISLQHQRSCWKRLGQCCLYSFIFLIFLWFSFPVFIVFMEYKPKPATNSRWFEL